ncbi:MAG: plasmid recombination protein [Gammaproteobacteria bacterium]|nr:plasmid recombination protein [Gammaproteobacteria bacterium]
MMKIGKGGVRGIQSHNQREKESKKNPDIDKTRSDQNYDILNSSNINYNRAVKERIDNFATQTATVRKDAVVMCNFIVTSDEKTMKAMSPTEQKAFFEDSTKFFMNRYGAENVVNATVHMDETTPHMHLGVVPITDERLSAKNLFTRKELIALQTDFAREVGQPYGLERGKEGSERTHLSEQRLKLEAVKAEVKEVKERSTELTQKYAALKENVEKRYKTLKNASDSLSKLEDHTKVVLGKLDKIEAKKGLFSDKLSISEQDYSTLVSLAKAGESKTLENLQLKSKVGDLEQKLNKKGIDEGIRDSKLKRLNDVEGKYLDLQRKYKNLNISFERVEKAIDKLDLTDKVNSELKALKMAEKSKSFDMSR